MPPTRTPLCRRRRSWWLALTAVAICLGSKVGTCGEKEAKPAHRLKWRSRWRKPGWWEAGVVGASAAMYGVTLGLAPQPTEARWKGPILVDNFARRSFADTSLEGRKRAALFSDVLLFAAIAQPALLDPIGFGLIGDDGNTEVAGRMSLIVAQSYAVTIALNGLAKFSFARERPYGLGCDLQGDYSANCNSNDRFRSYYSGHAALSATSAGLTCAFHTQLPLYGGDWKDPAACFEAIVLTTGTGMLRIISDNHWTTDVISGHLMGYAVGYLFPTLFYFRGIRFAPESHGPLDWEWTALPVWTPDSQGMQLVGSF